jgi:protein TonB
MKFLNSVIRKMIAVGILIFIGVAVNAQNTDDQLVAQDETKTDLKVDATDAVSESATLENNFVNLYEINLSDAKDAKVIVDTKMFMEPSASSESLGSLPKGAIVKSYKMLAREQMWAIKYNGVWGFVPMTSLMPVKLKTDIKPVKYDKPPKLKTSAKLIYPESARKMGVEGQVVMLIHIGKDGKVDDTKIVKSIPQLDAAAISTVKKVKFKPAEYKGKPVAVWVRFPVNFKLQN